MHYQSEWAQVPSAAARIVLQQIGVNPDLVPWWNDVATRMSLDISLAQTEVLPRHGWVYHYRPRELKAWLNAVTWRSEWPKYRVTDPAGLPVPPPAQPRSRRV